MKKLFTGVVTAIVIGFFCVIGVHAWTVAFDTYGKFYEQIGKITGTIYQETFILKKFTQPVMRVRMIAYKPGFLGIGWSQIGSATDCQANEGIGIINASCLHTKTNSGTKNIKTTWEQITSGQMSATIDSW